MRLRLILATCVLPLLAAGSAGGASARVLVPTEIAFWDARHGLAIFASPTRCEQGTCTAIGRTADGGRTWQLDAIPERWTDLAVVPGGGAWARVPPGDTGECHVPSLPPLCPAPRARRSEDGGRTWLTAANRWRDLRVASFPTRSHGYAFSGARLLRTEDRGRSWRELTSPCDPSWPAHAAFVTPARGWILCARPPQGYSHPQALFATRDGGLHWTLVMDAGYTRPGRSTPGAICGCGYPSGIAFARGGRGLIWQSGDLTYRTGDGGRTWSHVRFTVTDYVTGLSAAHVSATTAYLLVHTVHDRSWDLRRTNDGGGSWGLVRAWRMP
jgi:hypothetical protein